MALSDNSSRTWSLSYSRILHSLRISKVGDRATTRLKEWHGRSLIHLLGDGREEGLGISAHDHDASSSSPSPSFAPRGRPKVRLKLRSKIPPPLRLRIPHNKAVASLHRTYSVSAFPIPLFVLWLTKAAESYKLETGSSRQCEVSGAFPIYHSCFSTAKFTLVPCSSGPQSTSRIL